MSDPKSPIPVHTLDRAPSGARELLGAVQAKFGFIPNLLGVMANAPALLEGYLAIAGAFDRSSLSATERQIVLLTSSLENGCEYCVAAHSVIAGTQKVAPEVISALRKMRVLEDERLEALRQFTSDIVRARGWPTADSATRFTAAGYNQTQALEVVLGVGMKTLSNYCNHLAATPLDAAFAPARWCPPTADACGCAH